MDSGQVGSKAQATGGRCELNKYSSRITQPRSQGASQAMLYGIGLTDADLQKPQVGICSMWYEGNTCNMHLDRLAGHVKEGVQAAGLVGLRFNTDRRERRHLDGHRGHELFAAVARSDRRLDRDGRSARSGTTRSSPSRAATRTCRAA